jgi:hypothetical protein
VTGTRFRMADHPADQLLAGGLVVLRRLFLAADCAILCVSRSWLARSLRCNPSVPIELAGWWSERIAPDTPLIWRTSMVYWHC